MSAMYKAYIRLKVRKVIAEKDIDLERAINFLKENPKYGVIEEDGVGKTLEELQDAKNIGSSTGLEPDNTSARGESLSEGSNPELFGAFTDNTE